MSGTPSQYNRGDITWDGISLRIYYCTKEIPYLFTMEGTLNAKRPAKTDIELETVCQRNDSETIVGSIMGLVAFFKERGKT